MNLPLVNLDLTNLEMRFNISTYNDIFVLKRNPDHDLGSPVAIEICCSYGVTKTSERRRLFAGYRPGRAFRCYPYKPKLLPRFAARSQSHQGRQPEYPAAHRQSHPGLTPPKCQIWRMPCAGPRQVAYQSSIGAFENVGRSFKAILVRGTDHEVGSPIAIDILTSCDSVTKRR